jgi:hypothetical protein
VFSISLCLVCAWPLARNYSEYGGDFTGTHTMNQIWCQFLQHRDGKAVFPWPALSTLSWWRYVWFDFWGLFGMMDKYLWRPVYVIYFSLALASLTGWLGVSKFYGESSLVHQDTKEKSAVWQLFAICSALNLAAIVYVTMIGVSGPHGRYLFPCEIPLFSLLLAGFSRLSRRAAVIGGSTLIALCLGSSMGAWWFFYAAKSWSMQ